MRTDARARVRFFTACVQLVNDMSCRPDGPGSCACREIVSLTRPMVPPRTHPVALKYTTPYRTPAGGDFLVRLYWLWLLVPPSVNQEGDGSDSVVKRVRDALAAAATIIVGVPSGNFESSGWSVRFKVHASCRNRATQSCFPPAGSPYMYGSR